MKNKKSLKLKTFKFVLLTTILYMVFSLIMEYLFEELDIKAITSLQYFIKGCVKGLVFVITFSLIIHLCDKWEQRKKDK